MGARLATDATSKQDDSERSCRYFPNDLFDNHIFARDGFSIVKHEQSFQAGNGARHLSRPEAWRYQSVQRDY
jgi:hypothetical protein